MARGRGFFRVVLRDSGALRGVSPTPLNELLTGRLPEHVRGRCAEPTPPDPTRLMSPLLFTTPAAPRSRCLRFAELVLPLGAAGALAALASIAVAGAPPLSSLSDEFDDAGSLSNWSRIHQSEGWNADQLQLLDVDGSAPGRLAMIPWTSVWYADWRGELTYKLVSGDFAFTTEVHVAGADGVGIPEAAFSLAGPMIRAPRSIVDPLVDWTPGGENYVFLSCGFGLENAPCAPGAGPHLEVKTTENSVSTLCVAPIATTVVTIQIARIGAAVFCLYQEGAGRAAGPWSVHQRYSRADLPDTLQAGLVTYTDWFKCETYSPFFHNGHVLNDALEPDPSTNPAMPFFPDLAAEFEYARFATVLTPPELEGLDLLTEATDEQLLSFLGDAANRAPLDPDLNDDGIVGGADLGILLGAWGGPEGDLTGDGVTDGADLGALLGAWSA